MIKMPVEKDLKPKANRLENFQVIDKLGEGTYGVVTMCKGKPNDGLFRFGREQTKETESSML